MMEDGHGGSNKIPPFLINTYKMVEESSSNSIVTWSANGRSFIVSNPIDFANDLLPRYFKHNNFSSFHRQLNTYGFRKVASEKWEFVNDNFVRGQPHLMENIHRQKPVHSHSLQNTHGQGAATPLSEIERRNLNAIIENLKHENEHILLELQTQEEEKKIHETRLHYSKEHLKVFEQKQQSMLSYVGQALHKPEIECLIWSSTENTQRKRRYPRNSPFGNEASTQNAVGNSQVLPRENEENASVLSLNVERLNLLESSMEVLESIGIGIPHLVAPEPNAVVSPDPFLTEPEVNIAANLGVTEQAVINDHDLLSPEPNVVAVHENVSPEDQPTVTSPITPSNNDEFWEQHLKDESENLVKHGQVGRSWWN